MRPLLIGDVVPRVLPIGDRPAVGDHPAVQVVISFEADRDNAAIAVVIAGLTAYGRRADPLGQRERCLLAAAPFLTSRAHADLAALGSVNPMQANSRAVDLDRVAVYDGRNTHDRQSHHHRRRHGPEAAASRRHLPARHSSTVWFAISATLALA